MNGFHLKSWQSESYFCNKRSNTFYYKQNKPIKSGEVYTALATVVPQSAAGDGPKWNP